MVGEAGVAVWVGLAEAIDVGAEIETWLETETRPDTPLVWRPRGRGGVPVSDSVRLTALLGGFAAAGDWGVLNHPSGEVWAQSMRVHDGWIVEVNGEPGPRTMALRVLELGSPGPEGDRSLNLAPDGRLTASYLDGEGISTARAAARVMWGWMRGALPAGYQLREVEDGLD